MMRLDKIIFLCALLFPFFSFSAEVKYELDSVGLSQIVRVIYAETLKRKYVLSPELVSDNRTISIRFVGSDSDVQGFMQNMLSRMGYIIETISGVDYVRPAATQTVKKTRDVFIYRVRHRDTKYLADMVLPVLGEAALSNKVGNGNMVVSGGVDPASATAYGATIDNDVMIYHGAPDDLNRIRSVLEQIDLPVPQIVVRGVIYQVDTSARKANGLQVLADVLNSRLKLSLNRDLTISDSLSVSVGGIDAVISALDGDGRFTAISTPSVRVKNGSTARFSVGQDVPVLGSVNFQRDGQPVQSVEYRNSGVIFNVTPKIRKSAIELDVTQQISSFAKTETGVNNSPTLIKRELSTVVVLNDGNIAVIGGLVDSKNSRNERRLIWPFSFVSSSGSEENTAELVFVLQFELVKQGVLE